MEFSIKDFFSKCDQIRSFLQIWSHLLKKSLMENFMIYLQRDPISFIIIPLRKDLLQILNNQIIYPLYRNLHVKNTIKIKDLLRKILSSFFLPTRTPTSRYSYNLYSKKKLKYCEEHDLDPYKGWLML